MLEATGLEQTPASVLRALEGQVQAAFRTGRLGSLRLLRVPHGPCLFRLPEYDADVTAQRVASFATVPEFTQYRTAFDAYTAALERADIAMWPTIIMSLPSDDGSVTAYALQAGVPTASRLSKVRAMDDPDEILAVGNRLCDHIEDLVSDEVGLDASLDHWALVDDRLYYLAAATPRLRTSPGGDAMQLELFVGSLPGVVQGFARRNVAADLFEPFYSVRSVLLTLLARRHEPEDHGRFEPWLDLVNARTNTPLTEAEVRAAAADEAKRTRWIQRMRRLNATFQRVVRRRPYTHFFADGDAPAPK